MSRLKRMIYPKSIAIIGGGVWCENVIIQCQKMGFKGSIWPVHPRRSTIKGIACFSSIEALPNGPDASFIGVNRFATIKVIQSLNTINAQGAVCFASGFSEAISEDAQSADLQDQLLIAAGKMALLGPNCYGFINYLDGSLLWPDQHGGERVSKGVAIITQSSNIAINLTMQKRGLPIAFISSVGNQAQVSLSDIGSTILDDPRVTALGLHIEGIHDVTAFEELVMKANSLRKPIIALKVGASDQAQLATISHTASLAGSDAGAKALFTRLGVIQVNNLTTFLEALKLAHVVGKLPNAEVISMSCSGGEASLMADLGQNAGVTFPSLNETQKNNLRTSLGHMVKLANPLDYHTYIWGDWKAMTLTFCSALKDTKSLGLLVLDFPRFDRCDPQMWLDVIPSLTETAKATGRPIGIVASISDTMPEEIAKALIAQDIIPFNGMEVAVAAIAACAIKNSINKDPVLPPKAPKNPQVLLEASAKNILSKFNVRLPRSGHASNLDDASKIADQIGYPIVLKGEGIAHKTEVGAVILNLKNYNEICVAATKIPSSTYLVEEMINNSLIELLIGVVLDNVHGYVLTIAAGGQLTEILNDKVSLLIPANNDDIITSLKTLKIWPILLGYRGRPAPDLNSILQAINAIQEFTISNYGQISEIEINPLICTQTEAIVADALIKIGEKHDPMPH
jgi:acyl-CoA synthetase (NDP forming)